MIELIFIAATIYFLFVLPFKYWKVSGQFQYLKQDTDAKISQLEYNNNYYIDQINSFQQQVNRLERERNQYYQLWSDELDRVAEVEDIVFDLPESDTKTKILNILYPGDDE